MVYAAFSFSFSFSMSKATSLPECAVCGLHFLGAKGTACKFCSKVIKCAKCDKLTFMYNKLGICCEKVDLDKPQQLVVDYPCDYWDCDNVLHVKDIKLHCCHPSPYMSYISMHFCCEAHMDAYADAAAAHPDKTRETNPQGLVHV